MYNPVYMRPFEQPIGFHLPPSLLNRCQPIVIVAQNIQDKVKICEWAHESLGLRNRNRTLILYLPASLAIDCWERVDRRPSPTSCDSLCVSILRFLGFFELCPPPPPPFPRPSSPLPSPLPSPPRPLPPTYLSFVCWEGRPKVSHCVFSRNVASRWKQALANLTSSEPMDELFFPANLFLWSLRDKFLSKRCTCGMPQMCEIPGLY